MDYEKINYLKMIPECKDISYMALCGLVERPKLPKHSKIDIDFIIKTTYGEYDVDLSHMMTDSNRRQIVNPRFSAMYMLRKYTNLTFNEIGILFHKRHSDVIRSVNCVQDWIDIKDYAIDILFEIERKINEAYSQNNR